jgi:hypothetical protein
LKACGGDALFVLIDLTHVPIAYLHVQKKSKRKKNAASITHGAPSATLSPMSFPPQIRANPRSLPPSQILPPLRNLSQYTTQTISLALQGLRRIYISPQTKVASTLPDSGYASSASDDDDDEERHPNNDDVWTEMRNDPFERSFALRWLTGFISRAAEWVPLEEEDEDDREILMERAAVLLGLCSASSPSGDLERTFTFSSDPKSPGEDIAITLIDGDLNGQDHTSVGMQTWGSSYILSQRVVQCPAAFGLVPRSDGSPIRVLELGAGTGVVSLVVASWMAKKGLKAEVVATDFHPLVLSNLRANVSRNFVSDSNCTTALHVERLDWQTFEESIGEAALPPTFDRPFDIVFGADIIYQVDHARWIKATVERTLKISSDGGPCFYLIVPVRPTYEETLSTIEATFPMWGEVQHRGVASLAIVEKTEVTREAGVGRADEGSYLIYKIGWIPLD